MTLDYAEYEALFNTRDDEALVDRYFDKDVVFQGSSQAMKGHAELRKFLAWAHNGIRECMRPQTVIRSGNKLFAEVDMDFHSTVYRTDWPFAKLRPGDTVSVKFFVAYILNEQEKIIQLKAMTWAPGVGISKYPRLGASNNQQAAFFAYTSAFSAGEFETFPTFYTDDVVLKLPNHGTFTGRDAIVGFYKKMFPKVKESLQVEQLICDDGGICAKITSSFTAVEDTNEYFGEFKKGAQFSVKVFVVYSLRDGLISSIEVGRRE